MHYGKYRAKVVNTQDPEKRGRIKVLCPKIYGAFESPWCLPCTPFALDNEGIFFVPKTNEMIWIEFEEGDTEKPIWVGGLWKEPSSPLPIDEYNKYVEYKRIISTNSGHRITLCDFEGEKYIEIVDAIGSKIFMNSETGDITITAVNDLTTIAGNKNTSIGVEVHHN